MASRWEYAIASRGTRVVAPPIRPKKISQCGEGSSLTYRTATSMAASLRSAKLCDFQ